MGRFTHNPDEIWYRKKLTIIVNLKRNWTHSLKRTHRCLIPLHSYSLLTPPFNTDLQLSTTVYVTVLVCCHRSFLQPYRHLFAPCSGLEHPLFILHRHSVWTAAAASELREFLLLCLTTAVAAVFNFVAVEITCSWSNSASGVRLSD